MNLNKVILIGRLTAEPQLRATQTGTQVATVSLATNRTWFDKVTGGKKEETEFHNVVIWGKQAEIVGKFMTKGATLMIEGRLQTRNWEDKEGQKRKTTEIVAESIQLGPKPANTGSSFGSNSSNSNFSNQKSATNTFTAPKDDIPTIDFETSLGDIDFSEPNDIKPEDLPF